MLALWLKKWGKCNKLDFKAIGHLFISFYFLQRYNTSLISFIAFVFASIVFLQRGSEKSKR